MSLFEGPSLADRFEKGLDSLIKLLEGAPLPLAAVPMAPGRHSPQSVLLSTPCMQVPRPPIIIGGQGPRLIDLAARVGDQWNFYYPPGVESAEDLTTVPSTPHREVRGALRVPRAKWRGREVGRLRLCCWLGAIQQERTGRAHDTDVRAPL